MSVGSQRSGNERRTQVGILLACGVVAVALYLAIDVLASLTYEGYSFKDQTISELSAVGAPTRTLLVAFTVVDSLLRIAFGVGIWKAAAGKRRLQVVSACVVAVGVLGVVAWPFAPIHQREVLESGVTHTSDGLHVILVGINAILFVIAIVSGATAFGRRFLVYSIVTFLVASVAGNIAGDQASGISEGESTPGLGIAERISVYAALLWTSVLAVTLWRHREEPQARRDSRPES